MAIEADLSAAITKAKEIQMPFQITHDEPSRTPFLTLNLYGVLLIRPVSNTKCEIGIHRKAPPHVLKITLETKWPNRKATREELVVGHLKSKWFSIDVESPAKPGISAYQADAPFYRIPGADKPYDVRWGIDLEGDEFYRDTLLAQTSKIHPGVKTNNGTFYASALSDPKKVRIARSLKGKQYGMVAIAAVISAAIDIMPNSYVFLEWKDGDKTLFRQDDQNGPRYELNICNEPPRNTPPETNELANYHTALRKKDGSTISEKWSLNATRVSKRVSTDEIPCMSIILGGGS